MDGGNYNMMSGVCCPPNTTSQMITFGPRKRIDSTIHPSGRSLTTKSTLSCSPVDVVTPAWDPKFFEPKRLRQYTLSGIFVSVISISLQFVSCTYQIYWGGAKTRPNQMLYVPRLIPQVRIDRFRLDKSAVLRRFLPWRRG